MSERYTRRRLKVTGDTFLVTEDVEGLLVARAHSRDTGPEARGNARRLAACWNACEGMEDPEKHVDSLKEAESILALEYLESRDLRAQRDELVGALEETLRALESHLDESCRDHSLGHRDELCPCNTNEVVRARAALARARGEESGK
jgi:hypothetical protein